MSEEATVENFPVIDIYYCHNCHIETRSICPDYTCPICGSGFIEVTNPSEQNGHSDVDLGVSSNGEINLLDDYGYAFVNNDRRASSRRRGPRCRGGPYRRRGSGHRRGLRRRGGPGRRIRRIERVRHNPFEAFLEGFLRHLHEAGVIDSNTIGFGTSTGMRNRRNNRLLPDIFGDLWSAEELDEMMNHILESMGMSGPPPLNEGRINAIPTTTITQEQANTNLQCSICWEDFKMEEPVRELPCKHVYHQNCIDPWLRLHGTCPVCRRSLVDDGRTEDSDGSRNNDEESRGQPDIHTIDIDAVD